MSEQEPKHDMKLLTEDALSKMSGQSKVKDLAIVRIEKDVIPSTGKNIFRFYAIKKGDVNGPHYTVVIDEEKNAVDLNSLMKSEKVVLFPPIDIGGIDITPILPPPPSAPITVSPNVNNLTLDLGQTYDEVITVTVPKEAKIPKGDIYFLSDTTGSMSSVIAAVKAGANGILAAINIPGFDLAFGVGNYKDFPRDAYAFEHQLNPTNVITGIIGEINNWNASGGSDGSEGQLYALDQLAEAPAGPGGPIGWRPGAKRIIVWIGDYPGHDPICNAISPVDYDITEISVTNKLQGEGITVLAISTNTGVGLDANPAATSADYVGTCAIGGAPGQATRIAAATGGVHSIGITPANIATEIINLVTNAITKINNVNLVPNGATAPFVTAISPVGGYGPLPRDVSHTLTFKVQFTGVVPCRDHDQLFTGTIDVVADGVVVAKKDVVIVVPQCDVYVYSVKFVCGVQKEDPGVGVRPGIYATDINIHNYHDTKVRVRKYVLPLVMDGKVIGREPDFAKRWASDSIILPPNTATMDDCQRIGQLLLGTIPTGPMSITIGFFEIRSPKKLNVTAVYTVTDLRSGSIDIDVEQINPEIIDPKNSKD